MLFKKYNKVVLLSLLSVFLFSTNVYAKGNQSFLIDGKQMFFDVSSVKLMVNNNEIKNMPMQPIIYDNSLLVPVREVFEPLGAKVDYKAASKEVNLTYNNSYIALNVNNKTALVNGNPVAMDIPPKIVNNKLMIPLRFVSENSGFKVGWNSKKRIASVSSYDNTLEEIAENYQTKEENEEIVEDIEIDEVIENNLENKINKIEYEKDLVTVSTTNGTMPSVSYMTNPNRIVLDFEESDIDLDAILDKDIKEGFIENIRSSKYTASVSRIVIQLNTQATYDIINKGNDIVVKIDEPTFKNLYYDYENNILVLNKGNEKIDIDSIYHTDNYNKYKYVLSFDGDYKEQYGYGKYNIESDYLKSIDIVNEGGISNIIFDANRVLSYVVTEDNENYYINIKNPKELYNMIVVLDPGHGGEDPGAVGNGLRELDLNNDISKKVYDLIQKDGIVKAYFTRTEDYKMPLKERAGFANNLGDIFISFHHNSSNSSTPQGTEVYYYKHSNDEEIGFYSREMAQIMQNHLVETLGSFDRKIKSNAYTVVESTKIPAVLLEIGFISNYEEALLLSDEGYRQKAAEAIYRAILEVYDIYKPAR